MTEPGGRVFLAGGNTELAADLRCRPEVVGGHDIGRDSPYRVAGDMSDPATTFSVLTPPGAAAVAMVAVSGPRAWTIVRETFRPAGTKPLPDNPDPSRFWYGHFGGPPGDARHRVLSRKRTDLRAKSIATEARKPCA